MALPMRVLILPFVSRFNYAISNTGNRFVRNLKSVDIFDCIRNVSLTHTPSIHRHNFIFDSADITSPFGNDKLKIVVLVIRGVNPLVIERLFWYLGCKFTVNNYNLKNLHGASYDIPSFMNHKK